MHILLNPTSNKPIYEQIIQQVKERILQGVVVAGDKVPSVRELSAQLTVNPNTVSKAYKELEREGIFVTFRGKGTFINEDVHELVQEKEVEHLKEQAEKLVQSAKQAGVSKEEMKQWIDEIFQKGGGDHD
ncbi:GntR family transcriptional regulator [Alkalibacillus haloalkaliphilus]|uniref:GntR family transcriptional regulator n=1 Tax=Alkalibacillus haloalkaliphilus TaxID=94136 RepID=A0A511W655_9BACI|nr:GntR family transcriptional regulator [Alkalibacillus haloalkaliphilus]GEN46576.1 GntR family transcriptional regulator [Alkalibacillus haloalkaliphilus]